MNDIRLVIFDVDGLLLDTERIWEKAWIQTGEKLGVTDGSEVFKEVVGISGNALRETVYRHFQNDELADRMINDARMLGLQLLETELTAKDGAYEILNSLKKLGIRMAVATTTRRQQTMERLGRLNLLSYFDVIVCGDEVTKRKPDPEIYLKVLDHCKINPENAVVLEDSPYGVESAYRAGIRCIQIPDLIEADEKTRAMTVAIMPSLKEAEEYIRQKQIC